MFCSYRLAVTKILCIFLSVFVVLFYTVHSNNSHVRISCPNNNTLHTRHCKYRGKLYGWCDYKKTSRYEVWRHYVYTAYWARTYFSKITKLCRTMPGTRTMDAPHSRFLVNIVSSCFHLCDLFMVELIPICIFLFLITMSFVIPQDSHQLSALKPGCSRHAVRSVYSPKYTLQQAFFNPLPRRGYWYSAMQIDYKCADWVDWGSLLDYHFGCSRHWAILCSDLSFR